MKNFLKFTGFTMLIASIVVTFALIVKIIKAIGFATWFVYMIGSWVCLFLGNVFLAKAAKTTA